MTEEKLALMETSVKFLLTAVKGITQVNMEQMEAVAALGEYVEALRQQLHTMSKCVQSLARIQGIDSP